MFDFITYMRNLAIKSKYLNHTTSKPTFHRCSGVAMMEELLSNESLSPDTYHLVAEDNVDGSIRDVSDNVFDDQNYTFYVCKRVDTNDHDKREEVKKQAKLIAIHLISALNKHWREANNSQPDLYGLVNFNRDSIRYQSIGPVGTNYYGQMITFSVYHKPNIAYVESDWNDDITS